MANNIANQTKGAQVNSFTGGINTDLHPLLQPNDTLTDCVNGTLITYNGNENMLQNDMGNYTLTGAQLPTNYVPIGMKEYAGVLYIVAYNPVKKRVQLGSYPSPKISAGHENPQAEVDVRPFTIAAATTSEFNPMEILRNIDKGDDTQKVFLYSTVLDSANQLVQVLGSDENSQYYLTVNDQYQLMITSNVDDSDLWMQKLKFLTISTDGTIEDITDSVINNQSSEFKNVVWQSPGWIGVKYELSEIEQSAQYVSNVTYPSYKRLGRITFVDTTDKYVTGKLVEGTELYDHPFIMLPKDIKKESYEKCYWKDEVPLYTDTIKYYSDKEWTIKDKELVKKEVHSDSELWHEIQFKNSIESLINLFEPYDGEFIYMFLPKGANMSQEFGSELSKLVSSGDIGIIIHQESENTFEIDKPCQFLNIPERAFITISEYIKELYYPKYNSGVQFQDNKPVVHTVYCDINDPEIARFSWINVVSDKPKENDVVKDPTVVSEPILHYIKYTGTIDESNITNKGIDYSISENPSVLKLWTEDRELPANIFEGCINLEEIFIPESFSSIGENAFTGCTNTRIHLPESIVSISDNSFSGCNGELVLSTCANISPKQFTFSKISIHATSAVNIPDNWCADNHNIKELHLENIDTIGGNAFKNCENLEKVFLDVSKISSEAFSECINLNEVNISSRVKEIAKNSFTECNELLNSGIRRAGNYILEIQDDCTSIDITNDDILIVPNLFEDKIVTINICDGGNVNIDKNVLNNNKISTININALISYINLEDFSNLTTINIKVPFIIPNILGDILNSNLTVYVFDELVDKYKESWKISDELSNCIQSNGLSIDDIEESTTFIYTTDTGNMIDCPSYFHPKSHEYGNLTVYGKVECIIPYFQNSESADKLKTLVVPEGVKSIESNSFSGIPLTEITLPSTIEHIRRNSIYDAEEGGDPTVEKVIISDINKWCSVKMWDSTLTDNTPELWTTEGIVENIKLNNDVSEICDFAFSGYTNTFSEVDLSNIKYIGKNAFKGANIEKLVIKSNTTFGESAFAGTSIVGIHIDSIVDWFSNNFSNTESNPLYNNSKLYINNTETSITEIPEGVTNLKPYSLVGTSIENITIPEGVTSISGHIFSNNGVLKSITLPDTITSILSNAFDACTELTTINLPKHLMSIGDFAFNRCTKLENVNIPDSVTKIGRNAFYNCKLLKKIDIPLSVQEIGDKAFAVESHIDSEITVKNGVKTFGDDVFWGRGGKLHIDSQAVVNKGYSDYDAFSHFKIIDFNDSVTEIPKNGFKDNTYLELIVFPNTLEKIDRDAFTGCSNLKEIYIANLESWCNICLNTVFAPFKNGAVLKDCSNENKAVTEIDIIHSNNDYSFAAYTHVISASINTEKVYPHLFENSSIQEVWFGEKVKIVEDSAFSECKDLKNIHISESISEFKYNAFYPHASVVDDSTWCRNVYISNIKKWCSIKFGNISANPLSLGYLYLCGIKQAQLLIPYGVETISDYAFSKAKFTDISIPNSTTTLGKYAFAYIEPETIVVGTGVSSVGDNCFNMVRLHDYTKTYKTTLYIKSTKVDDWKMTGIQTVYRSNKHTNFIKDGSMKELTYSFTPCDNPVFRVFFTDTNNYYKKEPYNLYYTTANGYVDYHLTESWGKELISSSNLYRTLLDPVSTRNITSLELLDNKHWFQIPGWDTSKCIFYTPPYDGSESKINSPAKVASVIISDSATHIPQIINSTECKSINMYVGNSVKSSSMISDSDKYPKVDNLYIQDIKNWCEVQRNGSSFEFENIYYKGVKMDEIVIPENTTISQNAFKNTTIDKISISDNCVVKEESISGISAKMINIGKNVNIEHLIIGNDSVEIYSESPVDNIEITSNKFHIYTLPEIWIPKTMYGNIVEIKHCQIYLSGKDDDSFITDWGRVRQINDSETYKYMFPKSWRWRGVPEDKSFYEYNIGEKNTDSETDIFTPFKYCYNTFSKITDSLYKEIEQQFGWKISDDHTEITIYDTHSSIKDALLYLELVSKNRWFEFAINGFSGTQNMNIIPNIEWKPLDELGDSKYLTYTGDNLKFHVNTSLRVSKSSWMDQDVECIRCAISFLGKDFDGQTYISDVVEDAPLNRISLGRFYDLGYKFEFDSAIPETFTQIEIKSVFYSKLGDKYIIFDQTVDKDVLVIPEYVEMDFSNAKGRGLKYTVGEIVDGVREIIVSFETTEPVDGGALLCTLADYSGDFSITTTGGGILSEHRIVYRNVPATVQLAKLTVDLNGNSLINSNIILNTIMNEYSDRDDMSTISASFIINKLFINKDLEEYKTYLDEWPIRAKIHLDTSQVYTKYGRFPSGNNMNYELSEIKIKDKPLANEIAIVDSDGKIPHYEDDEFADVHYMPISVELWLGSGIKLLGTISDYTSSFMSEGGNKFSVEFKDSSFKLWEKTGNFISEISPVRLTPSAESTTSIPFKKRLLKHLYRPIEFNSIMKNLGFSEDDIKLFDGYWNKSTGLCGHQNAGLTYELRNTSTWNSGSSDWGSLENLIEKLPTVFPIKFSNEHPDYGINMPTAICGRNSWWADCYLETDRYDSKVSMGKRAGWYPYTTYYDWDTTKTIVSAINKGRNLYAICTNCGNTGKYTWFHNRALLTWPEYKKIEKQILLLGVLTSTDDSLIISSNKDLFFAKESTNDNVYRHYISNISGKCINCSFSYHGYTGDLLNFEFAADLENEKPHIDSKYVEYYNNELERYRTARTHVGGNPYISHLKNLLKDGWEAVQHPKTSDLHTAGMWCVKGRTSTSSDPFYFWNESWLNIRAGNGFHKIRSSWCGWDAFWPGLVMAGYNFFGTLETVTKKHGSKTEISGGDISPWALSQDTPGKPVYDIFCQIYKKSEDKFVDNKENVVISDISKSIDYWLTLYIKELIQERKYEKDYSNAQD